MKKTLLFLLCLMASTLVFAQKNLNSDQLKLRNDITAFLKAEGFVPEIDKDGDIKFKKEGANYYVIFYEKNESPMFISMERYYLVPEKYSETVARLTAEQLTRQYKGIKCTYVPNDKAFRISAQMFLRSSEAFTDVFYRLVSVMEDLKDELLTTLEDEASGFSNNSDSGEDLTDDETKQLYMDIFVMALENELGGFPSTVNVGKFNVEITGMETDPKSDKIIAVFKMPKGKSSISDSEKEQTVLYCESFCKGANSELTGNSDLKALGLGNLQMVYRLEDKNGKYIAGEAK